MALTRSKLSPCQQGSKKVLPRENSQLDQSQPSQNNQLQIDPLPQVEQPSQNNQPQVNQPPPFEQPSQVDQPSQNDQLQDNQISQDDQPKFDQPPQVTQLSQVDQPSQKSQPSQDNQPQVNQPWGRQPSQDCQSTNELPSQGEQSATEQPLDAQPSQDQPPESDRSLVEMLQDQAAANSDHSAGSSAKRPITIEDSDQEVEKDDLVHRRRRSSKRQRRALPNNGVNYITDKQLFKDEMLDYLFETRGSFDAAIACLLFLRRAGMVKERSPNAEAGCGGPS